VCVLEISPDPFHLPSGPPSLSAERFCVQRWGFRGHLVLDSAGEHPIGDFTISRDGKVIYFVRIAEEDDIWLGTLR
jgi:hypothetical protein